MRQTLNAQSFKFDSQIVNHLLEIEQFKGSWKACGNLAPERLTELKRIATIESIGSSTRIVGSKLSDSDVMRIMPALDNLGHAQKRLLSRQGLLLLFCRMRDCALLLWMFVASDGFVVRDNDCQKARLADLCHWVNYRG